MLIDGVMLLWFLLTALSVVFVAIDIRNTPEHPVMKWAFVVFSAYAGPERDRQELTPIVRTRTPTRGVALRTKWRKIGVVLEWSDMIICRLTRVEDCAQRYPTACPTRVRLLGSRWQNHPPPR